MTKKIYVRNSETLLNVHYFRRLAIAIANLDLPRREIPNWIVDTIYNFEGTIHYPEGRLFIISDTDIDDAFNGDGSFRWLSDFIKFATIPPKQNPQSRLLERLRLLDLALQIDKPNIWKHLSR